jgi:hypothetical protein
MSSAGQYLAELIGQLHVEHALLKEQHDQLQAEYRRVIAELAAVRAQSVSTPMPRDTQAAGA